MGCSILGLSSTFSGFSSSTFSLVSATTSSGNGRNIYHGKKREAVYGASATYAKEMERLSAKKSLLLAFEDAGGFEALVTGNMTEMQLIDVNERITGLERLNPTPRPTTSLFLEGQWNFEWLGSGSAGLIAARFIYGRFPSTLVNLSKMDVLIKDGYSKITAHLKWLNSIEHKFILLTKLSIEGPLRLKEEWGEWVIESPLVDEAAIPEQLRVAFGQAFSMVQQVRFPLWDALFTALKIPLSGTFQGLYLISYLDEEILIIRDTAGIPRVLTRLYMPASPLVSITEYES